MPEPNQPAADRAEASPPGGVGAEAAPDRGPTARVLVAKPRRRITLGFLMLVIVQCAIWSANLRRPYLYSRCKALAARVQASVETFRAVRPKDVTPATWDRAVAEVQEARDSHFLITRWTAPDDYQALITDLDALARTMTVESAEGDLFAALDAIVHTPSGDRIDLLPIFKRTSLREVLHGRYTPSWPLVGYGLKAVGRATGDPVGDLAAGLASSEWRVRASACRGLGELALADYALAIGPLARAVDDLDPLVRALAIEALGALGPAAAPAGPRLADRLGREDSATVRYDLITALGKIATPADAVVPALIQALRDPNPILRDQAVEACKDLGSRARRALPDLERLARTEPNEFVRGRLATAIDGLGSTPATRAPHMLARNLRGSNPDSARRIWLPDIVQAGTEAVEAVPDLITMLAEAAGPNPGLAARALMAIGPDARAAAPALAEVVRSKHRPGRASAAWALALVGAPREVAVPALTEALGDPDPAVRSSAAAALEILGRPAP